MIPCCGEEAKEGNTFENTAGTTKLFFFTAGTHTRSFSVSWEGGPNQTPTLHTKSAIKKNPSDAITAVGEYWIDGGTLWRPPSQNHRPSDKPSLPVRKLLAARWVVAHPGGVGGLAAGGHKGRLPRHEVEQPGVLAGGAPHPAGVVRADAPDRRTSTMGTPPPKRLALRISRIS